MARRKRAKQRVAAAAARQADRVAEPLFPIAVIVAAVLAAIGAFALYLPTAAHDIVFGDTPELTAVAIVAGVAHPPGYPLWTMLAHLFTLIPTGSLPFRVALFSVVCHALTVGVVVLSGYRLTRSIPAAIVAAAALATSRLFWSWSLVGEVFPLNDLLASLLVLFLVLWYARPDETRWLLGAAFVGGLGMTHHLTIVTLAPAALYVMWARRAVLFERPRTVAEATAAFGVGLLPLLYLPWAASRDPLWNWSRISSLRELWDHLLRTSYGSGQLITERSLQGGQPLDRVVALLTSFPPVGGALAALGALSLWRAKRERALFWMFAIAFAFSGVSFAAYANADPGVELVRAVLERFFLLPLVVIAPLTALGITLLADEAARIAGQLSSRTRRVAVSGLLGGLALASAPLLWHDIDQSTNQVARRFGLDILSDVEPNGIFFAGGDAIILPVQYLMTIEGRRPDVSLIALPLMRAEWYVKELKARDRRLKLDHAKYDGPPATMKSALDANWARPIAIMGLLLDASPESSYWYYSRGLTKVVKRNGDAVELGTMDADTRGAYARYDPPRYEDVQHLAWEKTILVDYAIPALIVGREYAIAKQFPGAREWFGKALAIHPDFVEAKQELARLPAVAP